MTDVENKALYIAEQCRRAGMTLAGVAGVLANVEAESAFKPTNLQDTYERALGYNDESYTAAVDNGTYHNFTGDAAGYGICQWTASDRKAQMLAYFRQRGMSIGDFRTQVDFLLYEMGSGYRRPWITCTNSNDPYQCGYDVCHDYEICANLEASSDYRGGQARKWYTWLQQHNGDQSEIPEEGQPQPETDDEGMPIEKTWPPRMLQRDRCTGWPEIKLLQDLLRCHGYNVLTDGIFGEELEKKVKQFQTETGLEADGIVGPMTWNALGIKF